MRTRGGLAVLTVDPQTGSPIGNREVFRAEDALAAKKVAVTSDGRFSIVIAVQADRNNTFITGPDGVTRVISLPEETDEVRITGHHAVIGSGSGLMHWVDLAEARLVHTWNFRQLLTPSGHKPESIAIFDEGRRAWVSFQKDSRSGKHLGSRLVLVNLETRAVEADVALPRSRPELHYDLSPDRRERGPSPEVLVVSPETNTLFVTLDLYGAVAMMDLDSAMRGELRNWVYLPTSLDGSWGTAFPDRALDFWHDKEHFVLVTNSSAPAGAKIYNLGKRAAVQAFATDPGLEQPRWIPAGGVIVAAPRGKVKARGAEGLTKQFFPTNRLHIFALADASADFPIEELRTVDLGHPLHSIDAIAPDQHSVVVINGGDVDQLFLIVDAATGEIHQTFPAQRTVRRTMAHRNR